MGQIGAEYDQLKKTPTVLPRSQSSRSAYDKTDFQGTCYFKKERDTFTFFLLNETGPIQLFLNDSYTDYGSLAVEIIIFFNNLKILPDSCCFIVVFDSPRRALKIRLSSHQDKLPTVYMPEGFINGNPLSDFTTIVTNRNNTEMTVIIGDTVNISLPANKNTFVTINNKELHHSSPPTDSEDFLGEILKRMQLLFISCSDFEVSMLRILREVAGGMQDSSLFFSEINLSKILQNGESGFRAPTEIEVLPFEFWRRNFRYPHFVKTAMESQDAMESGGAKRKTTRRFNKRLNKKSHKNKNKSKNKSKKKKLNFTYKRGVRRV